MPSIISPLFDRILELKNGEVITLNFATENDMNSKRAMLTRERKKYEEAVGDDRQAVFIHRETDKRKGIFRLHLSSSGSMLDWMQNATIKNKDGEVKNLMEDNNARNSDDGRTE